MNRTTSPAQGHTAGSDIATETLTLESPLDNPKPNTLALMIIPLVHHQEATNNVDLLINSEKRNIAVMKTVKNFTTSFEKRLAHEKDMLQTFSYNNPFMIQLIPEETIQCYTLYQGNYAIKNLDTLNHDLEPVEKSSLEQSNPAWLYSLQLNRADRDQGVITEYTYLQNTPRIFLEAGDIDLQSKLNSSTISPGLRCHYMHQILNCIHIMAGQNIAHRDIKPSNFVLFGDTVKVIDLEHACKMNGVYYNVSNPLVHSGGSPHFISPEQLWHYLDTSRLTQCHRIDVWSAGIVLILLVLNNSALTQCIDSHATLKLIQDWKIELPETITESFIFEKYQAFLTDLLDLCKKHQISEEIIALIRGMLALEIKSRYSAQSAFHFFNQHIYSDDHGRSMNRMVPQNTLKRSIS